MFVPTSLKVQSFPADGGSLGPVTDGPRWLDDDEQRAWRAFLEAATLLLDRLDADLRADAGMSHADFEILVRLSEADGGRLRMSDLAGRALFSRSRLSHAVARLEDLGWVHREPCPTDRRGTLAVLTPAGTAAVRRAAAGHVGSVRRYVFDHLSEADVADLGRLGTAIGTAVRGRHADATGSDEHAGRAGA
jgi:DNA-binding MarR family transcriptional regulator